MGALMDLCKKYGITVTYTLTSPRTGAVEPPTEKGGRPWRHLAFDVVLKRTLPVDGHEIAYDRGQPFSYRTGLQDPPRGYGDSAFHRETKEYDRYLKTRIPEVDDVIACLISDGQSYESELTFKDWASLLGYSDDSIKARDTYFACGETSKKIRFFLGDLYDEIAKAASEH